MCPLVLKVKNCISEVFEISNGIDDTCVIGAKQNGAAEMCMMFFSVLGS